MKGLLIVLVVAILSVSCGGGGDVAGPTSTSAAEEVAVDAASTTLAVPETPSVVGADDGLLPVELPRVVVLDGTPGPADAGRPTFEWEPVDGAVEYTVVVRSGDEPSWALTVEGSTATVGDGLDPAAVGPRVVDGDVWFVLALDADGVPIAQSAGAPVVTG